MNFDFLNEIKTQLEVLNGRANPLKPSDFIIATANQNALVVSQSGNDADLAICLSKNLIEQFQNKKFPRDFNLESFPDLSVIVEELSHFNFFCENALNNRQVSPLELEVQGEVDKFGFALECLHSRNESFLADQVFENLFQECRLGSWVSDEEKERYIQAHEVARAFCRRVLDRARHIEQKRELFQSFFSMPLEKKLQLGTG